MPSSSNLQTSGTQRPATTPPHRIEEVAHKPSVAPLAQDSISGTPDIGGKICDFFAWLFSPIVRLKNWVVSLFVLPAASLKPTENKPKSEEIKPPAPPPQPPKPVTAPQPQPPKPVLVSELLKLGIQTYCTEKKTSGEGLINQVTFYESPSHEPDGENRISMTAPSEQEEDLNTYIRLSAVVVTLSSGYSIRFKPSVSDYPIALLWTAEQISWKIADYKIPDGDWIEAYTPSEKMGYREIEPIQAKFDKPANGWPEPVNFQNWFIQEAAPHFSKTATQFTQQKPKLFSDAGPFSRFKAKIDQISFDKIGGVYNKNIPQGWRVRKETYEKESLSIEICDQTLQPDDLKIHALVGYRIRISHNNDGFSLTPYQLCPNGMALTCISEEGLAMTPTGEPSRMEGCRLDADGVEAALSKAYDMLFRLANQS